MISIETEKNAVKISRLIYQYRSVSWNADNIVRHVVITPRQLEDAVSWLRKKKYLCGYSFFFLTEKGNEYVEGLRRNVSIASAASEARFKNEVLSGIAEIKSEKTGFMVSEQSSITAAALPRVRRPVTTQTPETIMEERRKMIRSKLYLGRTLNLTNEEIEQHIESGRLQYCKSCQSIQLFDRKNFKRWHSVCKKCRKKQGV